MYITAADLFQFVQMLVGIATLALLVYNALHKKK